MITPGASDDLRYPPPNEIEGHVIINHTLYRCSKCALSVELKEACQNGTKRDRCIKRVLYDYRGQR